MDTKSRLEGLLPQPWPYDLFLSVEQLPVDQSSRPLWQCSPYFVGFAWANIAMDTSYHSWCKEGRWTSHSRNQELSKAWWLRYLVVTMANRFGRKSEPHWHHRYEPIREWLLEWSSWKRTHQDDIEWWEKHWNNQGPNSVTKLKYTGHHDITWYQTSVEQHTEKDEDGKICDT